MMREKIREFIGQFVGQRIAKKELEKVMQNFLGTDNKFENATDPDDKERDFTMVITNAVEKFQSCNLIDIEFDYLKLRKKGHVLITSAELLTYIP